MDIKESQENSIIHMIDMTAQEEVEVEERNYPVEALMPMKF